ncbi:uncharacterized protein LOC132702462 [Cylas formicarius]|uniref:uncharacterized protein LOC132702462 n=1 Tax=Cylas formicarius TaxID=197179 RepID=UPI002958C02B|nr:uncharacterized protein LOC132702462 [Cylas formicarius]
MVKILRFQLTVLKYLFVWPKDRLDSKTNRILSVSYFTLSVLFCLPILGAVLYEALNGMKDPNIAIEATIALCDATAYYVVFLCFLKNQAKIAGIVKDVNLFLNYCEAKLIEEIDATCHKYTKCERSKLNSPIDQDKSKSTYA